MDELTSWPLTQWREQKMENPTLIGPEKEWCGSCGACGICGACAITHVILIAGAALAAVISFWA